MLQKDELYIEELINNIINQLGNRRGRIEELDMSKVNNFIKRTLSILSDVYSDYVERTKDNRDISDIINIIGKGFFSIVIKVGDNIIKLSKTEVEEKILLDSDYQIPIYYKENMKLGRKAWFNIFVSPYVDTKGITYDNCFEIYSKIRNLGFIWMDPKEENIGRIISIPGCKIDGKRYKAKRNLKRGTLVAIDLQDIAYVGPETSDEILEEIAIMGYNPNAYKFETSIIDEKRKKKIY